MDVIFIDIITIITITTTTTSATTTSAAVYFTFSNSNFVMTCNVICYYCRPSILVLELVLSTGTLSIYL